MRKANCYNKKVVFIMCASLILWILGTYVITLAPYGDSPSTPYCQANLFRYGFSGTPAGSDHVIKSADAEGTDPNDSNSPNEPNEPNEPMWAEMADQTYFMIFIDVSDSMWPEDVNSINEATDMFVQYLTAEVYDGDLEEAIRHVIVEELTNERYLQHMARWNPDDPNATRYVNIFFTNEANHDYYTHDIILRPSQHFTDDLKGNQDCGGLIYGLRNELTQRTFSIGKVFNVGGREGNNLGCYSPAFTVHLYCAFNNVGEYADTNLGDLGVSYENIERSLAAVDLLQYMIDTVDYSAAYIAEEQNDNLHAE